MSLVTILFIKKKDIVLGHFATAIQTCTNDIHFFSPGLSIYIFAFHSYSFYFFLKKVSFLATFFASFSIHSLNVSIILKSTTMEVKNCFSGSCNSLFGHIVVHIMWPQSPQTYTMNELRKPFINTKRKSICNSLEGHTKRKRIGNYVIASR